MSQDSKLSVQLLDKIGAPLMVAINQVDGVEEKSDAEIAQILAQLLAQAVQMSTTLYNTLEIKEAEDQADTTRLALTALAAPFVAEFYIKRRQVPAEDNLKRMGKSFEAVIAFADNFSPASDYKSRLQTIDHDSVLFDKSQPILVTLQAMVPVINAVEEFSFGQSRRKLVQTISARLEKTASEVASKSSASDKLQELIIFKALAEIYTSCHRQETKRVSTGDSREELSLDPVWEKFDIKVAMMEALLGFDVATTNAGGQKAPNAPAQEEKNEQPAAPSNAPPATQEGTAGPMGFFKKPDGNANVETTEAAPAEGQPVATTPTPAAPSKAQPAAGDNASEPPPSNPMGFFKPGSKRDDSVDV